MIADCYIADCLRYLTKNAVEVRLYELLDESPPVQIDTEKVQEIEEELISGFNALLHRKSPKKGDGA